MRRLLPLLAFGIASCLPVAAQQQYCTGSCQVPVQCTQGTTTSISGTVYAPNGTDPLPNVTVYIAGAPVDPMTAGVSCPVPGAIPSGAPIAGATTNTDGTFTISNIPAVNPAGTPLELVIVTGKWRRIIPIDLSAGACTNTPIDPTQTRFPRNASEGDIPKFAIVTGNADAVECVVYKVMGRDSTEFTNPADGGRINFYLAEGVTSGGGSGAGSYIGTPGTTPVATTLTGDPAALQSYDVLMLPCEGADNSNVRQTSNTSDGELTNLVSFANAGGRIYASHYSYDWLNEAQTFPNVVSWTGSSKSIGQDNQTYPATINSTGFADGSTLAQWLALPAVNASATPGQIQLQTLRHDFNGVNPPTQSWMTLNSNGATMQFTFDTPVTQTTGQCGRVLFNEYHVETSVGDSNGRQFPGLCGTATTMTPQEKLLEYMLFNLTSNGGDPTLTPASADFGNEPLGFTSGVQTFTWTNHSIFASAVTLLEASGDFTVGPNTCTAVAAGASCNITVAFAPTALGPRTGTLTVGGGGKTLTAPLTGTGVPALVVSTTSLTFPSVDVGASATQSFTLTNSASGAVPVPALSASGDFTAAGVNCGSSLPAGGSCTVNVTFTPTATGTRTGSLSFNSTYTSSVVSLTGNGVDFSVALSPTSGTVIAGRSLTTGFTVTPIAGYASVVGLSCSTGVPGTTCTVASSSTVPGNGAITVTITTTSQYTVVGYSSLGGRGALLLLVAGSLWWMRRRGRSARALWTTGLAVLVLGLGSLTLSGCGNLKPAQNNNYTGPGSYTFTVTAADQTLRHSAGYTLNVTQN